MKITRIQHKSTLAIIQYLINDKRVSREKCNTAMSDFRNYSNSYTERTRSGHFKHVCHI